MKIYLNTVFLFGAMIILIGSCGSSFRSEEKKQNHTENSNMNLTAIFKKRKVKFENEITSNLDKNNFWDLVKYTKELSSNKEDQIKLLIRIFENKSIEQIAAFESIQNYYMNISYSSNLWAVAFYLNGGCSDDSFEYYRGWLISEGKQKFEILTRTPNEISKHYSNKNEINGFSEEFLSIGYYSIEEKSPNNFDKLDQLEDMVDNEYRKRFNVRLPEIEFNWETENDIENLFPEFCRKFK